ncbi:MAG: AAA family ATPase [bacterium]|nr:AAA family ATPase [bacterium]
MILAIANQKGGVGKTTTAVNLGASLGVTEKTVLLVDVDPQGNGTSGYGVERASLTLSVYDLFQGVEPHRVIQSTPVPNVDLIPSSMALAGAEIELVEVENREFLLKEALEPLRGEYDYILIDCPPSLGLLTVNALTAADRVLVPLQCEYYALEGLSHLIATIDLVRENLNPALSIEGILLTMFDVRNNLSSQVAEEVRNHFNDLVFETVVPRNVRLGESPSYGMPVLLYDIRSKGAQSYLELAKELIEHVEKSTGQRAIGPYSG